MAILDGFIENTTVLMVGSTAIRMLWEPACSAHTHAHTRTGTHVPAIEPVTSYEEALNLGEASPASRQTACVPMHASLNRDSHL